MDGGQQCSLNASMAEEAADEIERLRRELEEAQEANEALRAKALEWLNAYKAESEVAKEARCKAFEEAAELIEANIVKDSSAGKLLAPRQEGNRDGLHYAAAIRQLAEEEAR